MVNRTRAFRFSPAEMKKRGRSKYIVTRILNDSPPSNVASRHRFAQKSLVSRITCYFSLFLACPMMLRFPIASIHDTNARFLLSHRLPSSPEIFWLHERGARINLFLLQFQFLFFFFFYPLSREDSQTNG